MACTFCSIAEGTSPVELVYEDSCVLAFLDTHPAARGHTVVIPRRHVPDLFLLDDESAASALRAVCRVVQILSPAQGPDGLTLCHPESDGPTPEDSHFHLHLVPRAPAEGIARCRPITRPTAADLRRVAAELRGPTPVRSG